MRLQAFATPQTPNPFRIDQKKTTTSSLPRKFSPKRTLQTADILTADILPAGINPQLRLQTDHIKPKALISKFPYNLSTPKLPNQAPSP